MRKQRESKERFLTAHDEFMMTEYDRIKDSLKYTSEMGHNRMQFFVSVVSAVGAVLVVLFQTQGISHRLVQVLLILDVGLIVLGMMLFTRLTRRVVTKVQYFRALAKIRRYFVDQNPKIDDYLFYSANDDEPSFKYDHNASFSSLRLTAGLINSFLWAILSLCALYLAGNGNIAWWNYVNIGVITFALALIFHEFYSKKEFSAAEKKYEEKIDFPSKPVDSVKKKRKRKPSKRKKKKGPVKIRVQKVKSRK